MTGSNILERAGMGVCLPFPCEAPRLSSLSLNCRPATAHSDGRGVSFNSISQILILMTLLLQVTFEFRIPFQDLIARVRFGLVKGVILFTTWGESVDLECSPDVVVVAL